MVLAGGAGSLTVALLLPLILLFPDGRLPSRRWRPVLWAIVVVMAGWARSAPTCSAWCNGPWSPPTPRSGSGRSAEAGSAGVTAEAQPMLTCPGPAPSSHRRTRSRPRARSCRRAGYR